MSDSTVEQGAFHWSFGPVRAWAWLNRQFQAESERWPLWLPVGIGLGIAGYFALPVEPPAWLGPAGALPLGLIILLRMRSGEPRGRALLIALFSLLLGFASAQIETWRVAAPVLAQRLGPVAFSGHVTNLEVRTDGQRITLAPVSIGEMPSSRLPRLIRLRIETMAVPPDAGDLVEGTAMLLPPAAPDLPGGYDFPRQAYFQGLGAVGAAVGPIVVWPDSGGGLHGFITRWRAAMTRRIQAALPGTEGGVASALITGEKGAIAPSVQQDFRDAGLAHLLVIAGLHMTLVTGCAFLLLRGGLALLPRIALYYPIKKWAALAALVLACLYLVISGSAVPTQRAFTMCALALLAILYDRTAFSLFAVAWAASIVLLVQPFALTGGSFQMSFAAVVCLIAFHESYGAWFRPTGGEHGLGQGLLSHLVGIAVTTVVVTIGTEPYAIYHFSRFPVYSVLGNVLAVPVSAMWIMPWGLVGCLLMPFGLESLGLIPMGWGIVLVEHIAGWTAHLPGGILVLPAMPDWALGAISLGGLWWALWLGRWRYAGLVPIAAGMASMGFVSAPDIMIADDGKLAAIHSGHRYWFTSTRGDRFARETWQESDSMPEPRVMPLDGAVDLTGGLLFCRDGLCRGQWKQQDIALIYRMPKRRDACPDHVDILIVTLRRNPCATVAEIFDQQRAARDGAQAIWLGTRPQIQTTRALRHERPWVALPPIAISSGAAARPDDPAP